MVAEKWIHVIEEELERRREALTDMSRTIWENPEIGHQEKMASALLTEMLENNGFEVERGICGFETAFYAVKKSEKPGPVLGFVAEYDALPQLGHACGHNLFCCAAVGAAISVSRLLDELGGEVRVFGSPAEEGSVPNYGTKYPSFTSTTLVP